MYLFSMMLHAFGQFKEMKLFEAWYNRYDLKTHITRIWKQMQMNQS